MDSTVSKPENYILIPAEVKNCMELKPIEKLIFGDITCLCNQKGYCWAGNRYFAELYQISKRSVSRYINHLKELNFITAVVERDANKKVIKRTIKINDNPIEKTDSTSGQNFLAPIDRAVQYNNTSNNNKKEKDILFNEFWDAYDKKIGRGACKKKFLKLDINICEKCVEVDYEYSESTPDIQYRKHPITWLNQECWDDEITDHNTQGFTGNGFKNMVF
jgi:hypothetical protein